MLRIMMVLCFSLLFVANTSAEPTTSHHRSKSHHKHSTNEAKKAKGFPLQRAATGNRVFIFNPRTHAWAAYDENGERVNTGRASGGRSYCRDIHRSCRTIVGTFHVLSKGGASCRSKVYPVKTHGGAPIPYCMRFSPMGYAIHGASSVPGYNASHGCIRVSRDAARWLSQDFVQVGTTVTVLSY
jgi:lipoprotein-anchoring transpeptidase ErfK/SrfK